MDIKSEASSFSNKIKQSYTAKLIVTFVILLILMIPQSMVSSLVFERQARSEEAITEVSDTWSRAQVISGPFLTIPYKVLLNQNDKIVTRTEYAHFMPEVLDISSKVNPELRTRGIYEVAVYKSENLLNGEFLYPDFKDLNIDENNIIWNEATLNLGLSDVRGIEDLVSVGFGNQKKEFSPGVFNSDVVTSGISTKVDIKGMAENSIKYSIPLNLKGSDTLQFVPVGKQTTVKMDSTWKDPSFYGAFLPDARNISDSGFNADWKVFHLNRNFPQKWRNEVKTISDSAFGVKLYVPVDQYQKTERTVKYAVLIILLTFLAFFFLEVTNKFRIHPFQYLLVGLSLILFYSLLLSISEHINFDYSYVISGLSIITMITLYTKSIFKKPILAAYISLILLIFYMFVFVILQMQDYALLVGNIGLFIVMALVMYLSRKIDWYND